LIVVDTSALIAILLDEPEAETCMAALVAADRLMISAGTVAETLIVAGRRNVGDEAEKLINGVGFEVIPTTLAAARGVAQAYALWGKGVHPAGLNFGDCFAYQLAKSSDCPLLFVGNDFSRTDVQTAII
jgi:ribonuclease VapC